MNDNDDTKKTPDVHTPCHEYFISGPNASAIVYDMKHAEPVIAALCSVTEDDPDEYTVTDPDDPSFMHDEEGRPL